MSQEYENLVVRAENAAVSAENSAKQTAADRQAVEEIIFEINNEQIVSLQNTKESIRQSIVNKGQDCDTTVPFNQYASKINAIETGVDTSDATAVASDIRLNKTAYVNEEKITGNIPDVSAPEITLTVDENGNANATYTIQTGYVTEETKEKSYQIPVLEEASYTPSTSDQTISSGKYITGTQTIKGDSNLTSDNIKKGVSIFNVNGTLEELNTYDATATETDIAEGKTAYVNGQKITGSISYVSVPEIELNVSEQGKINASFNIDSGIVEGTSKIKEVQMETVGDNTYTPSTSDQTISSGKYLTGTQTIKGDSNLTSNNIKKGVSIFNVDGTLEVGVDTSDATATEWDIAQGKTAYVNGKKITGNISTTQVPEIDLSISSQGTVNASFNIGSGIVESAYKTKSIQMETVGDNTYTPSTSDQTISSGKYLTGTQTIKGDSNLKATNIKKGVAIFGVNGSYEGTGSGGTCKFYECTSVGDTTWSGYEWLFIEESYVKSDEITTGLSWTSVKPEIGNSYSSDALIQAILYQGVSAPTDYIIYYPMASADEFDGAAGQGITFSEDSSGHGYASFDGTGKIHTYVTLPDAGNPFSIVVSLRPTVDSFQGIIGFGPDNISHNTLYISSGNLRWGDWINGSVDASVPVVFDVLNTYVLVFNGTDYTFYGANGASGSAGIPSSLNSYSSYMLSVGGAPGWNENLYTGDMRDLYIFDRALTSEEVQALIDKGSDSSDSPEEPSTPDTPSDSVEAVSFTIKDAIEWDDVNGVYKQTEDTYGKTGKEAIYTMTSSNGTFKCHYVSALNEWHIDKEGVASRYYSPNGTDNPWDATNWYEYSTGLEDRSIKVELNQDENNGGSGDNTDAVSVVSIEVSDAMDAIVHGIYTNTEEGATGKSAMYYCPASDHMIRHDGTKWMIESVGGYINYYATVDADNPWEVPAGSWYSNEFFINDSNIKVTPNY